LIVFLTLRINEYFKQSPVRYSKNCREFCDLQKKTFVVICKNKLLDVKLCRSSHSSFALILKKLLRRKIFFACLDIQLGKQYVTDGLETTYTFDFLNVAQYHISGKNLVQNNFEKKSISIFFSESLEIFFSFLYAHSCLPSKSLLTKVRVYI
jgi:hypothetical protein